MKKRIKNISPAPAIKAKDIKREVAFKKRLRKSTARKWGAWNGKRCSG